MCVVSADKMPVLLAMMAALSTVPSKNAELSRDVASVLIGDRLPLPTCLDMQRSSSVLRLLQRDCCQSKAVRPDSVPLPCSTVDHTRHRSFLPTPSFCAKQK